MTLSATQRRDLKRQAHHLKVVVQTGAAGLNTAVVAEIERALFDHELLKIRLAADDRAQRKTMVKQLCDELDADCVQQIGHVAVLYRPRPEEGAPSTPAPERKTKK